MIVSQFDIPMNSIANKSISTDIEKYHLLNNKWKLWAHLPHDTDWSLASYKPIFTFSSVEDTIAICETLPEILVKNCMLFVMRDGVTPIWEDPKNRNGGCFSYKISNKNVYEVWKELTYVLVGETISNNPGFVNSITGITISPKKNFCIIKIWLQNCDYQNPSIVNSNVKCISPQGCLFKKHNPEY